MASAVSRYPTTRPVGPRVHARPSIASDPISSGISGARNSPARSARVSSTTPTRTAAVTTAPSPSPTPIAAPRLRPARLPAGRSVVGRSDSSRTTGSSADVGSSSGTGAPTGGGAGRLRSRPTGPVSPRGRSKPGIERGPVSGATRAPKRGNGSVPGPEGPGRSAGRGGVMGRRAVEGSDLEQLGLLVLHRLVDAVHVLLGEVVELLLRATDVVLTGLAVLGDAVELLLGPAADVADGHLGVLALGPRHLHQVAAALLGELREHQPQDLPVVGRVDAEVAVAHGLLDRRQLAGVVGLDDRHPRLGDGD